MGLLATLNVAGHVFLVVGTSPLAKRRRATVEKHGATAVALAAASPDDLANRGRPEVDGVVDGVFIVADTPAELSAAAALHAAAARLRIPINVADRPELCTFSLPSLFEDGPFQLGISTGGTGCRLATRLRRAAVNALPPNVGAICENVGRLRAELTAPDPAPDPDAGPESESHDDDAEQSSQLNRLVLENGAVGDAGSGDPAADAGAETGDPPTASQPAAGADPVRKKLRWLSQMAEYFPLSRLASVQLGDLEDFGRPSLDASPALGDPSSPAPSLGFAAGSPGSPPPPGAASPGGSIALVGAGPGSAGLLTTDAMREIAAADFVLADKLVPEEVLALVPKRTPVFIARKFPGNAERAQQELLEHGLAAARAGQHVVRLKQGDPYIYGRGAEEFLYFRERGFRPRVVAGVTSALAAPLLAGIAPTHRGAADQVLLCTGTGRAGALPPAPEWVESRTTVFLMALHRIGDIVASLLAAGWDPAVPCATIERASCPDQRVVRSRLSDIADALAAVGSRPPGLLVVGRACEVMAKPEGRWTVQEGPEPADLSASLVGLAVDL